MNLLLIGAYLLAIVLAVLCLLSLRFELAKRPATPIELTRPALYAAASALLTMAAAPVWRFELWAVTLLAGLIAGGAAALTLRVDTDFERNLVRVWKTRDGIAAATILVALGVASLIFAQLLGRQPRSLGVIAAGSVFIGAYFAGRLTVLRKYVARRAIHLDMKKR